nr:hypothetical protein [Malikia spinosa]
MDRFMSFGGMVTVARRRFPVGGYVALAAAAWYAAAKHLTRHLLQLLCRTQDALGFDLAQRP